MPLPFVRNLYKIGRISSLVRICTMMRERQGLTTASPSHTVPRKFSLPSIREMSSAPNYEMINVDYKGEGSRIGVISLNGPKTYNIFCSTMVAEMLDAITAMNEDPSVAVIILTGNEKGFVAGGDIKQMAETTFADAFDVDFVHRLFEVYSSKKPTIAAVNGLAIGGGCEVAMWCDIILAGEKAKFCLPEVKIGIIPAGSTPLLARSIGKSRTMQMCLTGEMITAQQASDWGLVSSVHPPEELLDAAVAVAEKIARNSKFTVAICKESVQNSFEMSLSNGLRVEKRLSEVTLATDDFKEGTRAFIEKRKPEFRDR